MLETATCIELDMLSLSLRISWRFFVPKIVRKVVCASSLNKCRKSCKWDILKWFSESLCDHGKRAVKCWKLAVRAVVVCINWAVDKVLNTTWSSGEHPRHCRHSWSGLKPWNYFSSRWSQLKQDHQWWRYHCRLFYYQSEYFSLIIE